MLKLRRGYLDLITMKQFSKRDIETLIGLRETAERLQTSLDFLVRQAEQITGEETTGGFTFDYILNGTELVDLLHRFDERTNLSTDVHTEHCCIEHGCKYGDEGCPVENLQKIQSFPCESCDTKW
jgi:hypothetical protein